MQDPGLSAWNVQVLNFGQALLGVISANFRMVALSRRDHRWKLEFYLERDDEVDREEIADVIDELEALQDRPTPYEVEITVGAGPLQWPSPPTRVLFRRRE